MTPEMDNTVALVAGWIITGSLAGLFAWIIIRSWWVERRWVRAEKAWQRNPWGKNR